MAYSLTSQIPTHMLRAYDIRGDVSELTADVIYSLGLSLGSEVIKQDETKIVIGRDGRLSSPTLIQALIQGLLETGCHIIDVGLVPTPVLYFATHFLKIASGVMLTGSHNPANYNGLKMVVKHIPLTEQRIL